MTIHLKADHEVWLAQQVAEGRFASIDEAVAHLIEAFKAEADDDDWVRPLLAEAEASIARGESIPGDVAIARMKARMNALR